MRIESTDAVARMQEFRANISQSVSVGQRKEGFTAPEKNESSKPENSEDKERYMAVSEKTVINAIEKANQAMKGSNTQLEFSVHEKTKQIMVKVINSDSREVIKEIPSEKILDMVYNMMEMAGIFVDTKK